MKNIYCYQTSINIINLNYFPQMKRFTITFAVAVLIGLVTSTNVTATTPVTTVEATAAPADYSGYAKSWTEQQTKYQEQYASQADSMGGEYVPETDYSKYQGETDKYMKSSTKLQDKFKKQTNNWMSYSDPSAYSNYQSDYASAYLPK